MLDRGVLYGLHFFYVFLNLSTGAFFPIENIYISEHLDFSGLTTSQENGVENDVQGRVAVSTNKVSSPFGACEPGWR